MSSRPTQSTGRGGRHGNSHGGRHQSKSTKTDNNPKKRELKFHPLGMKSQSNHGTFEETKDALVRRLAKKKLEYPKDIIDCVNNMQLLDIDALAPVRQYSTEQDEAQRNAENDHFASDWSYKQKYWMSRKESFLANVLNLYATIIDDMCTQEMQDKLKREPDYRTTLYNDPIELLKRIQTLMTRSDEADFELVGLWEAIKKLAGTHQGKEESVADYRRRWEVNSKAVEDLVGDKVFYTFIRNTQGYHAQEGSQAKVDYINNSWELVMASAFMYNANRKLHQSLIDEMNKKFALKHLPYKQRNEFPATIENAALILARHQAKVAVTNEKSKKKSGTTGSDSRSTGTGSGTPATGAAFAQTGGNGRNEGKKCYVCGSTEHVSPDCPERFRPQNRWFNPSKYRNYSALQVSSDTDNGTGAGPTTGTSNVQVGSDSRVEERRVEFNPVNWAMVQQGGFNLGPVDYPDLPIQLVQQMDSLSIEEDEASMTSNSQIGATVNRRNYEAETAERQRAVRDNWYGYKDVDVWDCGSNFDMLCTRAHADPGSIRMLELPFEYHGNTGFRALQQECDYQGSQRYLDEAGMTNIKSQVKAVDNNWRVRYDSAVDDAFYAYPPGSTQPLVYRRHPVWGLYIRAMGDDTPGGPEPNLAQPGTNTNTPVVIHDADTGTGPNNTNNNNTLSGYSGLQTDGPPTVAKNLEGFTAKQIARAKLARSVYHMAGAPDMAQFRYAIQGNLFRNCPITVEDVKNAEIIFGPSVSTRKGKRKRPSPARVEFDFIEIPREITERNPYLEMGCDLIQANNVVFLSTYDFRIRFRKLTPLKSRTKTALYEGLDISLRKYNHAGYTIRVIACDGEFRPIFDPIKDALNVHMNYTNPGDHEPHIERNNQYIKGLMRSTFHRMPYKRIPGILTEAVGERVTETSNFYPAKGGVSERYTPHMIIEQTPVDYSFEFQAETGSYVQAYGHETNNSQRSRTVDGIYLKPSRNIQEGHWIMDLNTEKPVRRRKVEVIPLTQQVIQMVEAMATREGVTDYRFYNRNGEVILDGDLLAGVDVDELWDDDYSPDTASNQDKPSDLNLRSEKLQQDELEDLKADYEEHYGSDDDNDSAAKSYSSDSTDTMGIYRRLRPGMPDYYSGEEEDQSSQEDDHDHNTSRDTDAIEDALDDLIDELEVMGDDPQQVIDQILDEDTEDDDNEDENGGNEGPSDSKVARAGVDVTDHDSTSSNDVGGTTGSPTKIDKALKKETRSGRSYVSNGAESRPTQGTSKSLSDRPESSNKNAKRWREKKMRRREKKRSERARKEHLRTSLHQILAWHGRRRQRVTGKRDDRDFEITINDTVYNLAFQQVNSERKSEYSTDKASLIARFMHEINEKVQRDGMNFIQQYYLNKGLKKFGARGKEAAISELDQLVKRNCWEPIHVEELTQEEKRRSVDSMMLLAEKNSEKIKGRYVYKGNETRDWLSREDTASPTASLESIMSTCVIDAYEGRDVLTADIPNAFIQTDMPEPEDGEARVIMKITGLLVDYLVEIDPTYSQYIVFDRGKRVIYLRILKAIYGMLQASLLFYKKMKSDLESQGFIFNPYDPCVCNKTVNGKQQTVRFHVDDLMSSHVDPQVNTDFVKWLNDKYGTIKDVTETRGKVHEYLGMTIDFTRKGKVKIRMDDYVRRMLEEFPIKFSPDTKQETPAGNNLLDVGRGRKLDPERQEIFHSFVAKNLFLSKRARLDILPTVSVLASRVREPNESDWKKLVRLMRYLHCTQGWHLTLSAKSLRVIKWYVDASFAVHPDFKSHTGAIMTMGKGGMQVLSRKQKLNTRSSTEAELVGVDDVITMILWTKLFMEHQGYPIEKNILYQDNQSAILLETNGRKSAGKQSRALNIRYFFVTDQVEKGNLVIEHCPTDAMTGDFFTKPLQGQKFKDFRDDIQGEQD